MNPVKNSELTVQGLLALRAGNDPVRVITERLRVKEMGPADHIRTKHEVKAFVESGSKDAAESLLKKVVERRQMREGLTEKVTRLRSQQI